LTRRILLLNLLLLALTVAAAWRLRKEWNAARVREEAVLGRSVRPVSPPPAPTQPPPAAVTAAGYADIAQKMLFSRDRNATVVEEPPPPPPPPPPMPALPVFRGVMNLGEGPVAILSERADAPSREFRAGQQVGEFKLAAIRQDSVVLEWNGQQITRSIEDQNAGGEEKPQEQATARTEAPPPAAAEKTFAAGPGVDIGAGKRSCIKNDSMPPGTVVGGLRKVVTPTPFGMICRWEPVN
jgi:hypothetical protein